MGKPYRRQFTQFTALIPFILGLALFLPSPTPAPAQTTYPKFSAYKESTKSAATEVITLQLPARASKRAELGQLVVYCTADTTITIEINGSTATTPDSVAITPQIINLPSYTPVAQAYSSSNSTGGTVLDKYTLYGDSLLSLNLMDVVLPVNQSLPKNITVRATAFTGTIRVRMTWSER